MDIYYRGRTLEKDCNSYQRSVKCWGELASKIHQRLSELKAADNLTVIYILPPARCHELKGDRSGQFAVTLLGPWRLVFNPDHDPLPLKDDGGIDIDRVMAIRIIGVINYHE